MHVIDAGQLSRVPDFSGIRREEFDRVVEHMKEQEFLFESGGLLSMGQKAEKVFGRKNFMELYAVFSSPVLFRVETAAGLDIGSLEQAFVDRLVQDMSSFLLGGRAWTVANVNLPDRVVQVREAPGGVKPSWGGYIPQHLSFDICNAIKGVLVADTTYPYVDQVAATHLQAQRDDLGELLRRKGPAIQLEAGQARWWTFAGGRINQTLKYGLEIAEGWKVVPDNFMVRIEGDGVNHDAVRVAIEKLGQRSFWKAPDTKRAVLARLPNYRLSKFQDCLPEAMALEMVAGYLLDIEGTIAWLAGASPHPSPSSLGAERPRVQLRLPGGDVPDALRPGLEGRWDALPDRLSIRDVEAVAHMVNGYDIGEQHLGLPETRAFDLAWATRDRWLATGEWTGTAVELLALNQAIAAGELPSLSGSEHGAHLPIEAPASSAS